MGAGGREGGGGRERGWYRGGGVMEGVVESKRRQRDGRGDTKEG